MTKTDKSVSNVVQFPEIVKGEKPMPSLIVEEYEGNEAIVKLKYEHFVNALAIYLQTLPFGIDNKRGVLDVDVGVPVDSSGYVTMDVIFDSE